MYSADLHIHSTASDGLLSPEDIINWSIKKGLKAISITDHDNVSAIDSAINISLTKDIEIIPGVELSTEYSNVEIHILGYFINYKEKLFNDFLAKLKESRIKRAKDMVKKLNILGYRISFEDVCETAKDASSIGRPHIARVMVSYGYCKNIEDCFERFLSFGKPAYVERFKISPFQAIEILSKCGGVTSIAHPGLIINIDKYLFIKKLKKWGLSAIEVYHTSHSENDISYFENMAKELDLIPTGGTDCHGVMINNEPMIGNITVPYDNVIRLKNFKYTKK